MKFKVGDRVNVLSNLAHTHSNKFGEIDSIIENGAFDYRVKLDRTPNLDHRIVSFFANELKLDNKKYQIGERVFLRYESQWKAVTYVEFDETDPDVPNEIRSLLLIPVRLIV